MDFDTLHLVVTTQWPDAEGNLDQFLPALEGFTTQVGSLSPEQTGKLRETVPVVLGKVMNTTRVWANRSLVTATNSLISAFLKLVVPDFQTRPTEVLEIVVEILKGENFFAHRGDFLFPPEGVEGPFAFSNDASNYYLASQTNLLGELGFFDSVSAALTVTGGEVPSIKFMKASVQMLSLIRKVLKPKLLFNLCGRYRDQVFKIFMGFEEEQLKLVTKMDVSQIVAFVDSCMKRVFTHIRTHEELALETEQTNISDKFCNDFALKCFKSTFLEKRIHGIIYIEDAVREKFHQAKKKISINWILEHQIVEMLFDIKTTRDELISKGKPIIKYVVEEAKLSEDMIDLIWACTKAHQIKHSFLFSCFL